LATGWPALAPESFLDATRNEDTIREWWTKWPDAAIGLWGIQTFDRRILPVTSDNCHYLDAGGKFYLIVFHFRDGKLRLAHAGAVMWAEHKVVHQAFRAWWAKVRDQDQPTYHGWIEHLTQKDLKLMRPSTTKRRA
jgi:hypothetical protein